MREMWREIKADPIGIVGGAALFAAAMATIVALFQLVEMMQ